MTIKTIEYIHKYDELDWEYEKTGSGGDVIRVDYISHVTEPYYAVQAPGGSSTNSIGNEVEDFLLAHPAWAINGTTLTVYTRDDVMGYLGLLNKLLDEEFGGK